MKVLLADDEAIILEGLKLLIDWKEEGFEIVGTASNGLQALKLIDELKPAIVISDIRMPEMTGLELLERVRNEKKSDVSFIFLTGYDSFDYAREAIRYHALDYLLKPIRREELLTVLHRAKDVQEAIEEKKERSYTSDSARNENTATDGAQTFGAVPETISFRSMADLFKDFSATEENAKTSYLWLQQGLSVDKTVLDELVNAVERNCENDIRQGVSRLSIEIRKAGDGAVGMIVNYLLFELLHVAKQINQEVDQEEVLRYTCETALPDICNETTDEAIAKVFLDYAEYLSELKGNDSEDILSKVESDIRKNYKDNLTLKDFSEKYYINASYLGQLFKAKYEKSFKSFLHTVRIEKAEELLINTDMKIYNIAEEVGYKDTDYFINHFIAEKGCTPTKFRKKTTGN